MGSEVESTEERLKSFLGQLQVEYNILDRIVYKNKNQHRRCSYFQFLMKVRRDIRLLQSTHLEEILKSSFELIRGTRPKQKVQLLESLKRKRSESGKHNFLERLLGAARLLSQMIEPMLKAATQISTLLAQSFFMGFSLTILALLARIRVLVQQLLLDVVDVFNRVSSLSQKQQSVKLNKTQGSVEVFREYYPKNQSGISLACVWESDKFVLHEKVSEIESKAINHDRDTVEDLTEAPTIKYQSIDVLLGGDELARDDPDPGMLISTDNEVGTHAENCFKLDDDSKVAENPKKDQHCNIVPLTNLNSVSSPNQINPNSDTRNKVAFISVNKTDHNNKSKGT